MEDRRLACVAPGALSGYLTLGLRVARVCLGRAEGERGWESRSRVRLSGEGHMLTGVGVACCVRDVPVLGYAPGWVAWPQLGLNLGETGAGRHALAGEGSVAGALVQGEACGGHDVREVCPA